MGKDTVARSRTRAAEGDDCRMRPAQTQSPSSLPPTTIFHLNSPTIFHGSCIPKRREQGLYDSSPPTIIHLPSHGCCMGSSRPQQQWLSHLCIRVALQYGVCGTVVITDDWAGTAGVLPTSGFTETSAPTNCGGAAFGQAAGMKACFSSLRGGRIHSHGHWCVARPILRSEQGQAAIYTAARHVRPVRNASQRLGHVRGGRNEKIPEHDVRRPFTMRLLGHRNT